MAYEHVTAEAVVLGKIRKDHAWRIIKDYQRYPILMENVDGVDVHLQSDTNGKSEWFVSIEGAPLRWVERDFFDKSSYTIRFESIDGDFDNINGNWKIDDFEGRGIKINFRIDYNLGIPVIEEVLGHILKEKMKSNVEHMVSAIKKELEHAETEERQHERFGVNAYYNMEFNKKEIRALLVNISCGGMQFYYSGELDESYVDIKVDTLNYKAVILANDIKNKNIRLMFRNTLSKQELQHLMMNLKTEKFPEKTAYRSI